MRKLAACFLTKKAKKKNDKKIQLFDLFFQVFFRAGVLGLMEEIREERIAKILSWLQVITLLSTF